MLLILSNKKSRQRQTHAIRQIVRLNELNYEIIN